MSETLIEIGAILAVFFTTALGAFFSKGAPLAAAWTAIADSAGGKIVFKPLPDTAQANLNRDREKARKWVVGLWIAQIVVGIATAALIFWLDVLNPVAKDAAGAFNPNNLQSAALIALLVLSIASYVIVLFRLFKTKKLT